MPTIAEILQNYAQQHAQDPRIAAALAKGGWQPPLPAPIPGFGGAAGNAGSTATVGALGQQIQALLAGGGQGQMPGMPGLPGLPNITAGGARGSPYPPQWGMPARGGYGEGYGMQSGMGKGGAPLTPGQDWGAQTPEQINWLRRT